MSKNRNKMPDVGALLRGPNKIRANAERIGAEVTAALSSVRAHSMPRGDGNDPDIWQQFGELAKGTTAVAAIAKRADQRVDEVQANLQAVEQRLAMMDSQGFVGSLAEPSIGATLAKKISEGDAGSFEALAAGNTTKASMKLETSIRAALTHTGTSSDTGMPSSPENGAIYTGPIRRLSLLDALPARKTTRDAVEFTRIVATDEAGVQQNEGDEKAEIELEPTAARAEIATIASHTTASKQVLTDHGAMANVVDRVMRGKVLSKVEAELINGVGGAGQVEGLLTQAPVFVPSFSILMPDIIGECLAGMIDDGYSPDFLVMNPLDWHLLQTLKSSTNEYLFGSPMTPAPPSIWNVPVILTSSLPRFTAMAIDSNYVTILDRQRLMVEASEHHKDNFTRNLVTVRCECRVGLEVTDQWALRQFELPFGGSDSGSSSSSGS
jgi:HK97 family phage major capsid protein